MGNDLPFSTRYSLPAQVSENLGETSWENVVQLSSDFQLKTQDHQSKVKKVLKELQMSRLLLMDRILHANETGKFEPKLLVDVVKLLQRSEEIAELYEVDLKEFSRFIYLVSEKLKKEKIAHYHGHAHIDRIAPIQEELAQLKVKSEFSHFRAKPERAKTAKKPAKKASKKGRK